MPGAITEIARAKVNLTLHVGAPISDGKWAGYHSVESLVVFADFGDELTFKPAQNSELVFDGVFGGALDGQENNSIHAALALCPAPPQKVLIQKNIPVAAGLGGGTADAAAVLRIFDSENEIVPTRLGADGPVCYLSKTAMMEGIGERITPQPGLGQISALLINPGVEVSTGKIFQAMDANRRSEHPNTTVRTGDLLSRALSGENEMQEVAIAHAPIIADVLRSLAQQDGCQLARMSGSGATCFGLFRSDSQAVAAAQIIQTAHPDWWVKPCRLGDPA